MDIDDWWPGLEMPTGFVGSATRAKLNELLQEERQKRDEANRPIPSDGKMNEQLLDGVKQKLTRLAVLVKDMQEVADQIKENIATTKDCLSGVNKGLSRWESCADLVKIIVDEINAWIHPPEVY